MKNYSTNAQLKAIAREQLHGKYLTMASTYIVLLLLQNFIVPPSALLTMLQPWGSIIYYMINFMITLFFAIFQVGLSFLFLSNACGQHVQTSHLYAGFTLNPLKAISIWVIPALLMVVPSVLPDLLLSWILEQKGEILLRYLALWICAVLPVASLIVLLIRIPYSMSFFIMLDFPELEAAECRRMSIKLMKGNKWRYFKLIISFLPLQLLGLLSMGIGMLYVKPYRSQACANFYLDLMQAQNQNEM